MKPLEQRLYEAFHRGRGLRLSADDVDALMRDDAVGTVVTHEAAAQAGLSETESGVCASMVGVGRETWRQFVRRFTEQRIERAAM